MTGPLDGWQDDAAPVVPAEVSSPDEHAAIDIVDISKMAMERARKRIFPPGEIT
ncbi:hypothetical protein GCM10023107_91790 [Actinoplanes octamycinicus]